MGKHRKPSGEQRTIPILAEFDRHLAELEKHIRSVNIREAVING